MDKVTAHALWCMFWVAALSLLLVGTIGGFWVATSYAAGIALMAWGYWIWVVCSPRPVCVRIRWYDGFYDYREVARG